MNGKSVSARAQMLRVGAVVVLTAGALAVTATPAFAVAAPETLTPTSGPSGGLNTITVSTPTTSPTFVASVYVSFQLVGAAILPAPTAIPSAAYAACWPTYAASIPVTGATTATSAAVVLAPAVVKYSVNKLYVTVPANVGVVGTPPTKYHVCVYSSNGPLGSTTPPVGQLIAATGTTAATQYSVSAASLVNTITPVSGPSKGGTPIIVTGTNLLGATATLGGTPITPLTIAPDGLSFTAVTPPHVAEALPVVLAVTTAGGTTNKLNAYTYSNGIIVTPNTAPMAAIGGTFIEIAGVGFSSFSVVGTSTNGTTPDSVGGHVYLNRGTYDRTPIAGHKTVSESTECTDVLVVSDVLMLCKVGMVPFGRTFTDATTYTVTTQKLTSATANFTNNDIGMPIYDTPTTTGQIGAASVGVIITSVASPTEVGLSAVTSGAGAMSATIGNTRVIASAGVANGGTTLTAATGTGNFTPWDVGRQILTTSTAGTGILAGTFIASYTSADVVELSQPTGAVVTAASVTITNIIPDGAYTITVVSDGRSSLVIDPNYNQSIISSGSTFTIGDYL